jgi:hypothetical protein
MANAAPPNLNTLRVLLIASVIALIAAPVIIIMGAFAPNPSLVGLTLLIIGALGLFAGMKALHKG